MPVSCTAIDRSTASPGIGVALTRSPIVPRAVNFRALRSRCPRTWRRRARSPTRRSGIAGSTAHDQARRFSPAWRETSSAHSWINARSENPAVASVSRPASSDDSSSKSPSLPISSSADDLTSRRYSRCSAARSVSSVSSVIPRIACIGVRSSWLMLARNSLLMRLAAWAASRASVSSAIICLSAVTSVRSKTVSPSAVTVLPTRYHRPLIRSSRDSLDPFRAFSWRIRSSVQACSSRPSGLTIMPWRYNPLSASDKPMPACSCPAIGA